MWINFYTHMQYPFRIPNTKYYSISLKNGVKVPKLQKTGQWQNIDHCIQFCHIIDGGLSGHENVCSILLDFKNLEGFSQTSINII